MNFSNLQVVSEAAPKTSSCKRKMEEENSMTISPKIPRIYTSYQPQNWSLPDSIIYYITQKPSSSKGYQKMIQSCKYFFNQNPILVVSELNYYQFKGEFWEVISGNESITRVNWNLKLWIIDCLFVIPRFRGSFTPNLTSSIIPKFYQCDIKNLSLTDQIISFKDFLFLVSNVIKLSLNRVIVKDRDDTVLPIEKIVEALPKVKEINIDVSSIVDPDMPLKAMTEFIVDIRKTVSLKTMKELLKIPHFLKLDKFSFYGNNETFDIETFYDYMKKNKHTQIDLRFDDSISQAYKNRLESIIDEIISTENRDYKSPLIRFPGMDIAKFGKLCSLLQHCL